MTSPRTPRQWGPLDSEPDRSLTLQDQDRDLIAYNFDEARGNVGWRYTWIAGHETYYGGVPWSEFDESFRVAWPLSEVLPETPEPPRGERPMPGCCGGCDGTGAVPDPDTNGKCADCYGTGHLHTGPCTPDPVPASQSVPAVPVSSTGGKETGEAAEDGTEAPSPVPYAEHERIVLEEIDRRDEAEEWADKLAAALAPPHVVGGHSLKNHPWRNALEWAQENRGPLPDSETEVQWSVREQGDERFYYHPTTDEEDAREEAACREGNALGKRQVWYGPWIEVTS